MKLLVIADDFTGANDTGAQLAKRGARTEVLLDERFAASSRADVLVVNTESRALSPGQAGEKVREALRPFFQGTTGAPQVFKKIDSTLRGNVGAEIEAAMAVSGARLAIIAPAIPAAGRTTRQGQCLVQGVPLMETEYASDPKTPILSSHIGTLIGLQSALPVYEAHLAMVRGCGLGEYLRQLAAKGPCCVVIDAENDGDLLQIARAAGILTVPAILAGAAGLAGALSPAYFLTGGVPAPAYSQTGGGLCAEDSQAGGGLCAEHAQNGSALLAGRAQAGDTLDAGPSQNGSGLPAGHFQVGCGLCPEHPTASGGRLPVLAVAGSMSDITRRQIAFAAREQPLGIVDIEVESLLAAPGPETMMPYVRAAAAVLEERRHCVLRTCRDAGARRAIDDLCRRYGYTRRQLGEYIGSRLGEAARLIIAQNRIGGGCFSPVATLPSPWPALWGPKGIALPAR
ncbi:four-carbon acid sugar kinase family protein [Acerihabitans sp. KWT182]|uniref:Four-carbon acid sugar kinase family protein n=1 Tax=Acerihabitans sp. KWT182 TaxID=3157919 RepID=A0AAU7Q7U3_9GAMM